MIHRSNAWALWLVLSLAIGCRAVGIEDERTPAPIATPENNLGIHLLLTDGLRAWPVEVWQEHMTYARQAVGQWGFVTELVREGDLDPARWQVFMDLCAALQLTPILRLATTFDEDAGWWLAPLLEANGSYHTLAAQYAQFVAALDWPTEEHFIIVGNEPNHGNEWSGLPDPAAYARFLVDVADALHAADPAVRVLNAGLDTYTPHTGSHSFADGLYYIDAESFIDGMVTTEPQVLSKLDAWASHSYPMGPFSDGPWQQIYKIDLLNDASNAAHREPPEGVVNRGVNGFEWELWKLATYGVGSLPVMITETGWRHVETNDPNSPDNSRPLPDGATAAAYLDMALNGNEGRYPDYPQEGWRPWLSDSRILVVTPFALNGDPAFWGHSNWLELDASGAVLGSYPMFDLLAMMSESG